MRTRILLTAVSLFALPLSTEAQWNIERRTGNTTATTTGSDGQVQLAVSCREANQVVILKAPGSLGFHDGDIEARWDDGSTERYTFVEQDESLLGSSEAPQVRALIAKLRQRHTVRLRVNGGQGEPVSDLVSLAGSSQAIGSLPCTSSLRASAADTSRRTDAEIRRILIRQSIARYSGSCPCPYNSDRAGRRCGGRSAYSRPGGASPLCYPSDVSDGAVEAYRRRPKR